MASSRYVLTPEKLHRYVTKRLFRNGITAEELKEQHDIHLFLGYLQNELEGLLKDEFGLEHPEKLKINQVNPREPIYWDGINTYIPISLGTSRMKRYLDMRRWLKDCVHQMPEIYGSCPAITFRIHPYENDDSATFERYRKLSSGLVREVLSFEDCVHELKGVIFNSVSLVRATFLEQGVAESSIISGAGHFYNDHFLNYQFVKLGDGYVLNLDYSYGTLTGLLALYLAEVINHRAEEGQLALDNRGRRRLALFPFGKAGSIASNIHIGSIVAPNAYYRDDPLHEGERIHTPVHNEMATPGLIRGLILTANWPQTSVIDQTWQELEQARMNAGIVEMEMKDLIEKIDYMKTWLKKLDVRFGYLLNISDEPFAGRTIEDEDLELEKRVQKTILARYLDFFDSFTLTLPHSGVFQTCIS